MFNHPIERCALAIFATAALSLAGSAQLDVVSFSVDPATHEAKAKLFNSSQKTIVAMVIGCGQSTYMEDAPDQPEKAILPGDTAERDFGCLSPSAAHVLAVVYSDRTAEGDPQAIAQVFTHRKKYAATMKAQRDLFATAQDADTALAKLKELKSHKDLDPVLLENTAEEVVSVRAHGNVDFGDFRSAMREQFTRDAEIADQHMRRAQ